MWNGLDWVYLGTETKYKLLFCVASVLIAVFFNMCATQSDEIPGNEPEQQNQNQLLGTTPTPNATATSKAIIDLVSNVFATSSPTPTMVPTSTPILLETVQAMLETILTAVPTNTIPPKLTPDLHSTTQAIVELVLTSIPTSTPTPLPIMTNTPTQTPPPASKANNLNNDPIPEITTVINQIYPWVVSITVETLVKNRFLEVSNQGMGSGFIIRPDGYIVTSQHVVSGASSIQVHLNNGDTYSAIVIGEDEVTDLAVLKIDANELPTAIFADSDQLKVGDWVLAIGNALAIKGGPTVTFGIVSGLGRTISTEFGEFYNLVQTDAAVNEGNSGGPLVNLEGEVIGINQAILRQAQGVGFAVSSSIADPIVKSLILHGHVKRPLIGFSGMTMTTDIANQLNIPFKEGVIVTEILSTGPAFKAGMRVRDVMTKIDNIPTPDVPTWLVTLWSYQVGAQVEVEYEREGEAFTTVVQLTQRPQ